VAAQFLGELTDETSSQAPAPEPQGSESDQNSVETKSASVEPDDTPAVSPAPDNRRSVDVATQQERQDEPSDFSPQPRRHGGALPE
jgi:hypothetical protein